MYCTDVTTIGDGTKEEMSPKNLLTTTITDELRMATNFQERLWNEFEGSWCHLPAGHFANWAFGSKTGSFILVPFLWSKLPDWVKIQ
jgi:hypothetical protein